MHDLYAIFKNISIPANGFAGNLVNERGNLSRLGVLPGFSASEAALSVWLPNLWALIDCSIARVSV